MVGAKAILQRCTLHKRRNVIDYLPVARRKAMDKRLGITGAPRRSLTNTNCIESMISTGRVVTQGVKNWQDGETKKRWIATGMSKLNAPSVASAATPR